MTEETSRDSRVVQIWRVSLGPLGGPGEADEPDAGLHLAGLLSLLDAAERTRAGRFRRDSDRTAFIRAHAALRICLADQLGSAPEEVRFHTPAGGKPMLDSALRAPSTLDFSLSHSGEFGLVGIAMAGRIGVDIEQRVPADALALARRWFAPEETAWLELLPTAERDRRFLECWTRKEAYLKALGLGLSGGLTVCRCELPGREANEGAQARLPVTAYVGGLTGDRSPMWRFVPLDSPDAPACAAVDFQPSEVVIREFSWALQEYEPLDSGSPTRSRLRSGYGCRRR
jgi:phosphopantetheinyl transferase